jgi:L-ascorbate metabolism protein UlaG (beta-lactamase superfamily)
VLDNVEFLGHATFKIKGSQLIYTEPYNIGDEETADIIFITHSHFDHLSPEDIRKISDSHTTIVASNDCMKQLQGFGGEIIGLVPYQNTTVNGVIIEAVPAYNIHKEFHPKANNWNGYVFKMDEVTYYHPGDTDKIPEMNEIRADVVFLPVGGTYTMDYDDAAAVVSIINPQFAVPMHYGSIVGSDEDAKKFIELCEGKGFMLPAKYN